MIVSFEREPFGWVHPLHYRQRQVPLPCDWESFVEPAFQVANILSDILQLDQHESRKSEKEEQKRDKFEVKMDVQQFSPEELDVKIVDNCLIIEAKHEEKKDEQGFVSRHILRRYQLPDDVKQETLTCSLNSKGVLSVSASRMIEKQPEKEKTIPISVTGQPAAPKENDDGMEEKAKENGSATEDVPENVEK